MSQSGAAGGSAGDGPVIDKFSHGVVVVQDIRAAVAAFRGLSFTVEEGSHYGGGQSGTNAYVRFGRAFLELLSIADRDAPLPARIVGRVFQEHVRAGASGLLAFGLGARDVAEARRRFDRTGLPHYRIDQSMRREDGQAYGWTVYILRDHPWLMPWPVVSRYDEAEEARMSGHAADHDNGARRILACTIRVPNLPEASQLFADQLGLRVSPDSRRAFLADGVRIDLVPAASGPFGIHDITIGVADLDRTRSVLAAAGIALPPGDRIAVPERHLLGTRIAFAPMGGTA
jgi:hypothetical protein